ncbi:MAG TPA: hypothetical protein ENH62_08660 [Marinobacter sp.]|uniref:Uncharacterized protein n=1 Tax=marine sediment metagenome TaxID=412755 RepID=A0A0F9KSG3_9ZZZZ|nr:hypothetical protein [Marinobacter sp.]
MRNIKLLEAWGRYVKGDWAAVTDKIAENLIAQGIAIDPARPKPEPVAAVLPPKPKAAKKKAKTRRK